MGLGAFFLLFCILLIWKVVRIFIGLRSPGSGGRGNIPGSRPDGEGEFDADAVLARYMAQRQAEAAPGSPAAALAQKSTGQAKRPGFGRKSR